MCLLIGVSIVKPLPRVKTLTCIKIKIGKVNRYSAGAMPCGPTVESDTEPGVVSKTQLYTGFVAESCAHAPEKVSASFVIEFKQLSASKALFKPMIDLIQPGLRAPKFKPHLTTVGKLTKFQGVVETLPGTALYLGPGFQG